MKHHIWFFLYLCKNIKLIITFIFSCCSLIVMGQIHKEISLRYNLSDFMIGERDSMHYISSYNPDYIFLPDTTAPALPYFSIYVLIESCMEYVNHTTSYNESFVAGGIHLSPNPQIMATNSTTSSFFPSCITYNMSEYPSAPVAYKTTFVIGGYKILAFSVCPFRYDAVNKQLYLKNDMTIDISLTAHSKTNSHNVNNNVIGKMVERLIVNKSDISLKRLVKHETSRQRDTPNYEYLIVTCDSLKSEFQRLADWKTMKGVRAKVITIEEIYHSLQGTTLTHQQQIKQTLLDYYEASDYRLQYVLLGGSNDIIPTELCYIQCYSSEGLLTRETATDLYYASLKNLNWDTNNNGLSGEVSDSIDFSHDIIVTRLSVQNTDDVRIQVNRILHYEQNPDIMDWSNRILLCGACLKKRYHYPDGYITDTHFKAEQYLYNNCILPYWQNGVRYKLYDTGSSFEGDALYDFNVSNLQDQFRRGYTFVNVDTHGEFDNWKMEYKPNLITFYENLDAENMENIKANTIITTTACLTNDYTESQPCLSECFMRNPNSGIIGYYGCSKEGWYFPDSITEGSSLKYDRKMYECLFRSDHHQLGAAIYDSKMSFDEQCSYYGSMRWLMFGLNALCDPEMPVFLSQPQSFTNVQISRGSNSLTVNTGGVSDCRICVMSWDDNGYSYYAVEDSVDSQSFLIGSESYNVCITKAGYIPYIAVVGNNVYLQNEDIEYDLHIFANQTFIGNNVIPNQPTGNVNILKGKTTLQNMGTVTIPSGFKVEKGASFVITH